MGPGLRRGDGVSPSIESARPVVCLAWKADIEAMAGIGWIADCVLPRENPKKLTFLAVYALTIIWAI